MGKLPNHIFFFLLLFSLAGCYEPQEGCLDIDAVDYDVNADDPCADCCTFPSLTLSMQHVAQSSHDSAAFRYDMFYPGLIFMPAKDSFWVDRARFFISNIRLIKEDGEVVGVTDTLQLEFLDGTAITISDNFAKLDRDNFQARNIGTVKTEGIFKEVQFTFGLEEFLLGKEITSDLPSGHPLDTGSDSLIYEVGTGFIPNLLIIRKDTMPWNDSLIFNFLEPIQITLPFNEPLVVERGFNIKLTLRTNYMSYFAGVDFVNDSFKTMEGKIKDNLRNVFSVTDIKLE